LILIRSMAALNSDLADERAATVQSIALLGLALAGITFIVLHFRLHRPVRALQRGIQRVAEGDLSLRLHSPGRDEVAELAREFDRMADALERARDGLAAETRRRQHLEQEIERVHRLVVVGELAAVLAHEIGSPLQVLQGRATMLAGTAELPEQARRNAEIIVEQTTRVAAIVEQLLGVARRRTPRFEPIDPTGPVRTVVEFLEPHARRAGVRLEASLTPMPLVRADAPQLQQIMLNLIQNAVRAADSGGVVRIEAALESVGTFHQVRLAVADSGPGIEGDLRASAPPSRCRQWDPPQLGLLVVPLRRELGGPQ
jgi:signal transduction histidine kinase